MTVISDVYFNVAVILSKVEITSNKEGIITFGVFSSWFLTELCLYIATQISNGTQVFIVK